VRDQIAPDGVPDGSADNVPPTVAEEPRTVPAADGPTVADRSMESPTRSDPRAPEGLFTTAEPVTVADPVPAPVPTGDADHATTGRSTRNAIVAGLAGGLVGALVAAGTFALLDDDSSSTTAPASSSATAARPSNRIATAGDIASILEADVPAIVAIVDDGGPGSGGAAGTGFVVSSDGVIVTNSHVVDDADTILAHFSDGAKREAKVLGSAPNSDLAVLKVDGDNLPTIELGDSDSVQVGDDVVAIGNALALEGGLSVTRGIVSGLHRDVPTSRNSFLADLIQTDAAINPGNSGGPLVDARGRVIAINTAIANPDNTEDVGFAIPISQVKSLIRELQEGRRPPFLGVATDPEFTGDGALIQSVTKGSAADEAGLRVGDVVTRVGSTPVHTSAGLKPAIRRYRAGQEVEVVVRRDDDQRTLRVTLDEADEATS
jgi:putative serine protease PepD